MDRGGRTREELIKQVWPDKVLYAATLLMITSLLGILQGLTFAVLDVPLVEDLPGPLEAMPPVMILVLSLVEAVGAGLALRRQQTRWTLGAGVVGVLSLNLFGLGSILALIALGFVGLARREGEDAATPEERVPAETWPDKAFAASTLLVVAGVLTTGWGIANAGEAIVFEGYMPQVAFGWLCVGLGLLALVSAWLLYRQRGPWLGVLASLGAIGGLALYAVGPLLGLGGLFLIWLAHREDEFSLDHGAGRRVETG